jgi:hypothetical protein
MSDQKWTAKQHLKGRGATPLATVTGVVAIALLLLWASSAIAAGPTPTVSSDETAAQVDTTFTYQGRLQKSGQTLDGTCDFQFSLWDADSSGVQQGSTQTKSGVQVSQGLFTVSLDFGPQFTGDARWMETAVQCAGDSAFTTLSPRTPLTPVPYASYALGPWTTGVGKITYTGDKVGIGTVSPSFGKLHVAGGSGAGVYGTSSGGSGVVGESSSGGSGVAGLSYQSGGRGVYGYNGLANSVGVFGEANAAGGVGVYGTSTANTGVYGVSSNAFGVWGASSSSVGVYGQSLASSSSGILGISPYIGVQGNATGTNANRQALRGDNAGSATGYAGYFYGNVAVYGTLTKNAGAFRIDHPLDPANKYLYHSFVESPDMKNIYDGVVTTDANGDATVELPDWFEALNQDFRYQLTSIGQFSQAIVSAEIAHNRFSIKTDRPFVKVSWQVTGIRHDPYAEARRVPVEQDKPAAERGHYIFPEGYGQPYALGVGALDGAAIPASTVPSVDPTEAPIQAGGQP